MWRINYNNTLTVVALAIGLFVGIKVFLDSQQPELKFTTPTAVEEHYIGKVKFESATTVRLLILKHSYEPLAEMEQRDIIQAANLAASKGLSIKDLGGHEINADGPRLYWGKQIKSLEDLQEFVSAQMKISAEAGDTLIIYTTGHGAKGGFMDNLGSREKIGKILAAAAAENNQETLWWQSSCYAGAGLPNIKSMTTNEQELFSMIASSDANNPSYWGDQTEPMKRVFMALASSDKSLDPNGDYVVTSGELTVFLNNYKSGAGDLVYARSTDEPIFGFDWLSNLPVRRADGTFIKQKNFVPRP